MYRYIEIRTNPDYKYDEVLADINYNFALTSGSSSGFSGGTISGTTNFLGQILSGGTDLYSIFSTTGDITRIQPGANISTGGTIDFPIINLSDSPSVNNLYFSGTANGGNLIATALSGTNIFSGSTNLNDLFSTLLQFTILENQISTKANLSGATFTGGVVATSISANTISATTYYGGAENLTGISGSFGITIDGHGAVLTPGIKGYAIIPYNATILGWDIISSSSGSCSIDVLKSTSIPTTGDTISGTQLPSLSNQQKNSDNNLISWNTSLFISDVVAFNVVSASTLTWVNLVIKVIKT